MGEYLSDRRRRNYFIPRRVADSTRCSDVGGRRQLCPSAPFGVRDLFPQGGGHRLYCDLDPLDAPPPSSRSTDGPLLEVSDTDRLCRHLGCRLLDGALPARTADGSLSPRGGGSGGNSVFFLLRLLSGLVYEAADSFEPVCVIYG